MHLYRGAFEPPWAGPRKAVRGGSAMAKLSGAAQGPPVVQLKPYVTSQTALGATGPRVAVRRDSQGGSYIEDAAVTDHKKLAARGLFG